MCAASSCPGQASPSRQLGFETVEQLNCFGFACFALVQPMLPNSNVGFFLWFSFNIYLEYTQIVCCSPFFVSIALVSLLSALYPQSVSSAKYQWLQKISVACWMASMLEVSMLVASMLQVSILVASVAAKDIC